MTTNARQPTAVVTGAGGGIGREIAVSLLAAGFAVALLGRREVTLTETVTVAAADPADVLVIPTDVTDEAQVTAAFERVRASWPRLDVLVNNAGIGAPGAPVDEVSLADWNAVLATNVTGTFLCTREAMRLMRAQQPQGGRIINNGSLSAHRPRPGSVAYTASKHAVAGITKTTALDGRAFSIACSQFDVGNAATEMTSRMTGGVTQADGTVRSEPTFDAAEVGRLVAHMAALPPSVTITDVTIMATTMPYVGRG